MSVVYHGEIEMAVIGEITGCDDSMRGVDTPGIEFNRRAWRHGERATRMAEQRRDALAGAKRGKTSRVNDRKVGDAVPVEVARDRSAKKPAAGWDEMLIGRGVGRSGSFGES